MVADRPHQLKVSSLLVVVSLIGFCSPVSAESVFQRDMAAHDSEQVASLAREVNSACQSNISFRVDYSTYSDLKSDVNNQNPWAYMANAMDAMKKICRTENGKQIIRAKITSVISSHATVEQKNIDGGVFRFATPYARGSAPEALAAWLDQTLAGGGLSKGREDNSTIGSSDVKTQLHKALDKLPF